jgi:flagellar hook-associated protein 2
MSGFSGIDTKSIVEALMAAENNRLTRLNTVKSKLTATQTAWTSIQSKLSALTTASSEVLTASRLSTTAASTSDSTKATVSGTPTAGSISFGVSRLASTSLVQIGGLSSTIAEVGAGTVALNTGLGALGIADVTGGTGTHNISVTQASSKAQKTGSIISSPVTITTANRTLTLQRVTPTGGTVNTNLTLTTGTFATPAALAANIQARMVAAGMTTMSATADANGRIVITQNAGEGSGFKINTTGTAIASLGLTAGLASGVDAVVDVGGTITNLTNITSGATLTLNTGTGPLSVKATGTGHLAVGAGKTEAFTFGAGTTIDQVAAAIGGPGSPVTTQLVGAPGSAQLLIGGRASGAAAATTVTWTGFGAGSATTLTSGDDALLTMGSTTITRSTNVVTDLMSGATINLVGTTAPGATVTISAAADTAASTAKIKGFVTALNDVLATIDKESKTNPSDISKAGALVGNSSARSLRNDLVEAMGVQLSTGTYRTLSAIGISITRAGAYTVDEAKLKAAIADKPDEVAALVSRGVTASDSRVSYASAQNTTATGSYGVQITQAASRATALSSAFGTLGASETLTVTAGTISASFTAGAGMNASQVAAGLSQALYAAGVPAFADVTLAGQVRVLTNSFGSSASLSITSTGGGTGLGGQSASGTNVAGTIGGVAGTGNGQVLTVATGPAAGLGLIIKADAAAVAGAGGNLSLGSASYNPGASGFLKAALERATGIDGPLTNAQKSLKEAQARADKDITAMNRYLDSVRARLNKQYSALETALASMNNTLSSFSAAAAGLNRSE